MKRLPVTVRPLPIRKQRTILFAELPPEQVPEAADYLGTLERLEVNPFAERLAIDVGYDLRDHSLEELEEALVGLGFHLDTSLLSKLRRALIFYAEETQLHNLEAPPGPQLKKSQHEAYTHAWERHPHGDHDDTPPEWREYR